MDPEVWMRKFLRALLGGIERKILLLFIFALVIVVVTFSLVISDQLGRISEITSNANRRQQVAIREKATATTSDLIEQSLGHSTVIEAALTDSVFKFLRRNVEQFAKSFMVNLQDHSSGLSFDYELSTDLFRPNPEFDGLLSLQFLPGPNTDVRDSDLRKEAHILCESISTDQQYAVINGFVNSAFIVSPKGYCITADMHSANKFDENGNLVKVDLRQRDWYKKTLESYEVSFSDVHIDLFSKKLDIVCSYAVRDDDGNVLGVVGMDVYLDTLNDDIDIESTSDRFIFIVNKEGKVMFSPSETDMFVELPTDKSYDLREFDYPDLTRFLNEALAGSEKVYTVNIDERSYFMIGAQLATPGWVLVSAIDQMRMEAPVLEMERDFNAITEEATEEFNDGLEYSRRALITMIVVDVMLCTVGLLFMASRIVKPLSLMAKKISKIKGDDFSFDKSREFNTNDEIEVLADAFSALSVRTKKYIEQISTITAEKERIGAELDVATKIQADMLPRKFPPFPEKCEFDIYASMTPAKEVGGDFYDFFLVDDDHIALVIADVSGKGVPAALFMVVTKTLIKNRTMLGGTPAEILYDVNNQLCQNNEAEFFVTVWLAIINIKTGEGVSVNSGHEYPALRRAGGKFELIKYKHSPALAIMSDIRFENHEFKLNPGDALFVYTDGVTEATNDALELFGNDRLIDALNNCREPGPEALIDSVSDGISEFVAEAEQFDDITMLSFTYMGPEGDATEDKTKRLTLEAKIDNLDKVLSFIDGILETNGCPVKIQMQMDIAVEEIFVNIAHYAYAPNSGTATISASFDEKKRVVSFSFIDGGVQFNPLERKDPDITMKLEDRKIGGLGIFMVKQSMDNVRYEYRDGLNILTIEKRI